MSPEPPRDKGTQDHLKAKIADLEVQMQTLIQQYEAVTNQKPKDTKRISFSVTHEQAKALNVDSARHNISRSALLQSLVFSTADTTKALT